MAFSCDGKDSRLIFKVNLTSQSLPGYGSIESSAVNVPVPQPLCYGASNGSLSNTGRTIDSDDD
jgi:hypothetical protein